jgi:predicted amidohydrolase
MRIGFCQIEVAYKDIQANIDKIDTLLSNNKSDLVVLPELCFTGYSFNNRAELISLSTHESISQIIESLHRIAITSNSHIVAGISEWENEKLYNTAVVVGPKGLIGKHRKINLTKNETIFDSGDDLNVFTIDGVKIGIAICFDTWFPESFRILALHGAQIICCPSNFGGPWTPDVIKVRALENCIYTIMANRIGKELMNGDEITFRGESEIVDFNGNILIKAANEECVKFIDVEVHQNARNKNIICNNLKIEREKYTKYVEYKI